MATNKTTSPSKKKSIAPAKKKSVTNKSTTKNIPAKAPTSKQPSRSVAEPHIASDAVEAQLARYRSMRDFGITAEPSGSSPRTRTKSPTLPFCIQKHAASHLHYDFRLAWNGVLKSWAVAKGPSYSTKDKRLAVQVEDHPIEYGGFEGIIPQGQYGGGTVMLWDQGTWEPQPGHTDVDAGLREGSLKFILNGTKLHGKWALIRMGGKAANERKPNWLLIKEHDEFERPPGSHPGAVTETEPNSVVTGRTMEQIAASEDHVWNSKQTANGNAWYRQEPKPSALLDDEAKKRTRRSSATNSSSRSVSFQQATRKLPQETQPAFIKPQLALEAENPPHDDGWIQELKLDGYRMQARKDGSEVQMLTRNGLDWTARMPQIASAIATLPVDLVTLDGEVVVLTDDGTTSFAELQAAFQQGSRKPLTYFCFDLLHLNGHSTRTLPLTQRKDLLQKILASADSEILRFNEHLEGDAASILEHACKLQAEGIICKRAAAQYRPGRGGEWMKLKCLHEQEFVIGGYTFPSNGTRGIGSLLLGYYHEGNLIYAGRTGTGFTQKMHHMLRDTLDQLQRASSPFHALPSEARHGAHWVRPTLVAQVRFATWTASNLVRQAAFLGLREDKAADDVHREAPSVAFHSKHSRIAKSGASVSHGTRPPVAARRNVHAKPTPTRAPVRLTHPDKVLDVDSGLTKQILADYYWQIAPHLLPYISGRPVSLVRCPDGSGHPCFFQKHVNATLPAGIASVDVPDKHGKVEAYITLDAQEQLAALAQLGVLELHPWGSRNSNLEHADRLIFDLDPDEALGWPVLAAAASDVRGRLRKLGLESFLKTTGGKGLHVVAPIQPEFEWSTIKEFAHAVANAMERDDPSLYLTKMTKTARKGKIYVDYLRNERGATAVAPYSPRARSGAPVSMPLAWSELKLQQRPIFRAADFASWQSRLKKDPWKKMESTTQRLTPEALIEVGVTRK